MRNGTRSSRYERLLARRPEAYADHAAAFFMGIGNRPQLAFELASMNWKLRDTPRSRSSPGQGASVSGGSPDAWPRTIA